jgi:CCR4-NOT transcription complex subunit 6
VCLGAGYPAHDATFCSKNCFVTSWKEHSKRHVNARKLSNVSEVLSSPPNELEEAGGIIVKTTDGNDWVPVGEEKIYTPTSADIGYRLRIDISAYSVADNTLVAGPIALHTEPVLAAPRKSAFKRVLQTIPHERTVTSGSVRFRIVSYNILAEKYATKQAYPYCDSWNLQWPYRRKILFEELEEIQGDIVCLQEVQGDHFETDINPFMNSLGYDGIYKQKSIAVQFGKIDGCATFWKKNKFSMSEQYGLEFNDLALNEANSLGFDESEARRYMNRLNRDNIAQIVVLESLSRPANSRGRALLCIVNTHIYSNNHQADVKLWQTMNLIREVQQFVTPRDLALMICGDFNSEPTSAVYEFLMNRQIINNHAELITGDRRMQILPDLSSIVHGLELGSAMSSGSGYEPQFTNYTAAFKGCLDYIFYSPGRLKILAVSSLPDENDLKPFSGEGLPCACYPSDHMWLSCDVAMVGSGSILNGDMGMGMGHGSGKMKMGGRGHK